MKFISVFLFSISFLLIFAKENPEQTNTFSKNKNLVKVKVDKKNSLLDFGAIGDGKTDDSQAFIKALEAVSKTNQKKLIIPGDYIFNLNNKLINFENFPPEILLEFEGGYLINANLNGQRTRIKADRIKIFENINLSGSFISVSDYAYPEWYGVFPYDIKVDLVDALRKLEPTFYDISLGVGDYYTKKGEYMVKGLKGVSMAKTKVILETDKSNTYIFSLGKVGGKLEERNYDYNYIKDLTIVMQTPNKIRLKGNRGIVVGAAHKPVIENVKVFLFGDQSQFSKTDLEQFLVNPNKMKDANVGLEFNGDSEVINISNFFTLSDIGVMFTTFCDFVTIRDYMSWTGLYGLANVYYQSKALPSQNILFTGAQSWNQGLYGLYTENSITYNSFPNVKFENLRIEQLTSEIQLKNKLEGANIWIGENETISNLQFNNVMLADLSNGVRVGKTTYGRMVLENILTWSNEKTKKNFALETTHSDSGVPFIIYLKNANFVHDANSKFNNGQIINNTINNIKTKQNNNFYTDAMVISKASSLRQSSTTDTSSKFVQEVTVQSNNTNYIALDQSKLSDIIQNKQIIKYSIEYFAPLQIEKFEFAIYPNGTIKNINNSTSETIVINNQIVSNKLNLTRDKDSGFIFIFNRLKDDVKLKIVIDVIEE